MLTGILDHSALTKFLELTTPIVSCNISGWTFTKTTYYNADGSLNSTAWHNDPIDPVIKISSDGHGLGFAQVQFMGKTNGTDVGNQTDISPPIGVGWPMPGVPLADNGHDTDISVELMGSGSFNEDEGTYFYEGTGIIHYTPYYFIVTSIVDYPIGRWMKGATATTSGEGDGDWKVKHLEHTFICEDCSGSGCPECESNEIIAAGDTYEASVTTDEPYSEVNWYIKRSGETGLGTWIKADSGNGMTTNASLSYTFPNNASGDYVITAHITWPDDSTDQVSATVTVTAP